MDEVWTIEQVQRAARALPDPALAWDAGRVEYRVPVAPRIPVRPLTAGVPVMRDPVPMMTFQVIRYFQGGREHFHWCVKGSVIVGEG